MNTRPIQKAPLETFQSEYKVQLTEIKEGKPIETVWQLDPKLMIKWVKMGTAPIDRINHRLTHRHLVRILM